MKGIYLTQEGKQEIEAKIAELEQIIENNKSNRSTLTLREGLKVYKEILSSAIILPIEESWDELPKRSNHSTKTITNGKITITKIL